MAITAFALMASSFVNIQDKNDNHYVNKIFISKKVGHLSGEFHRSSLCAMAKIKNLILARIFFENETVQEGDLSYYLSNGPRVFYNSL